MANQVAQTYIDDTNKIKKDVKKIEIDASVDKLTGDLVVKDFPELTAIVLKNHGLVKFAVENCPKLTTVNISNNRDINKVDFEKAGKDGKGENLIEEVRVSGYSGKSGCEEINLKNCTHLDDLVINDLGLIKSIKGAKDFDNSITQINVGGSSGLHLTTTEELERLEAVEKVNNEILGGSGDLPMKTGSDGKQVVDTDKLKNDLGSKAAENSLNSIGEKAGLTGNDAKDKGKIIAKIEELKQQVTQAVNDLLTKINNLGLGLTGADINEQEVLNKITELINRPTRADYDKIKGERDTLKNGSVESDKVVFGKLGISVSDYESKIVGVSASEVEKVRNELIEKRFGELSNEKNTSFYLNIGLGILVIGSLAGIIWLLLRENKPKTESEPESER